MKLITFELKGKTKIGALFGDRVLDLQKAYDIYSTSKGKGKSLELKTAFSDMISFLGNGDKTIPLSKDILNYVEKNAEISKKLFVDFKKVNLKAPIPHPPKAMISGPSWKRSIKEGRIPEFIFLLKPPTAVIGPGDDIRIPRNPVQIVTEVELAIIIGKPGRYIPQDKAWDHIAGFTVFNDVTDMGLYREQTPPKVIRSKSYDTFAVIGPCITLKDQMGDVQNIELKLRLNGEERVRIKTNEMIYPLTHFVSSVSETMTLQVGDVISTGCPMTIPVKPGDVVEAEIENIGILKNQFVEWKE
jgi:acylpyruvate hydrolase